VLRDPRNDIVDDAIEPASHGVSNHLNRFSESHMADGASLHLRLELLARQPRANLLLKREPANPRILHAFDGDPIDPLAYRRQGDRQRIHREPRIHAGAQHRHPGLASRRVDTPGHRSVRSRRIRRLLRGRHDRHAMLEHFLELRDHRAQRRTGAEHRDVWLAGPDGRANRIHDLHAKTTTETDHVS